MAPFLKILLVAKYNGYAIYGNYDVKRSSKVKSEGAPFLEILHVMFKNQV